MTDVKQRFGLTSKLVVITGLIVLGTAVVVHYPKPVVRDDCPHDWTIVAGLAGDLTDIPEFHDCQATIIRPGLIARLLGKKPYYGQTIGVFVSRANPEFWDSLVPATYDSIPCATPQVVIPDTIPGGVRARTGIVSGDTTQAKKQCVPRIIYGQQSTVARTEDGGRGIPTIQLYNFASKAYKPLGIKEGFSCLYITLSETNTFEGWMVHTHPDNMCPAKTRAVLQASAFKLEVKPDMTLGTAMADYPPVARWDWDRKWRRQYIGFRCLLTDGNANVIPSWCDIGREGFTVSQRHHEGAPPELAKYYGIPGWYDEQRLAVWDTIKGKISLSSIRGVIVPDAGLGARKLADYGAAYDADPSSEGGWLPAWRVYLSQDDERYKARFNFSKSWPARHDNPGNLVELRMLPDSSWEARITSPNGDQKIKKAKRVNHEDLALPFEIPGTVRWRWLASVLGADETNWGKCEVGCCRIDP